MSIKITIITVCKDSLETISHTLNSVKSQSYKNIEHVIIDGKSIDGTLDILKKYKHTEKKHKIKIFSDHDCGIYDAINKGISKSTGQYICILNSDDIFQSNNTIEKIVEQVTINRKVDIFFYGLVYFSKENFSKIVRYYPSHNFKSWMINFGIIPPHPASIIKKKIYLKYGLYDEKFKIAGDFDFFARLLKNKEINYKKKKETIIRMKTGGESGKNIRSYITSLKENYYALKKNNFYSNYLFLILKIPSKLSQFLFFNEINLNSSFSEPKKSLKNIFIKIKIIKNINKILKSNFVLSGLNLAFIGYYFNKDVCTYKNLLHWPDGLFSKLFTKKKMKKIPGRSLVNNLHLNRDIKRIRVIGPLSQKTYNYLKQKFNKKIIHNNLPFGSVKVLIKYLPKKIYKNELIFITLPTPKQEIIAEHFVKFYKNYKIICIGASLSMCSGEEKIVPLFLDKIGLEFLWRLRNDTFRRILRLAETFYYFLNGILNKKYEKIKISYLQN